MTRTTTSRAVRASFVLALVGSAAILSSCGGSSNPDPAPRIGALADQVVNQDTTVGPIPVSVSAAGSTGALSVTAAVADATLVPSGNITLGGTGSERTLTLLPAPDQVGSTTVTVTAADAMGRVTIQAFRLTVNPVYAGFTQYATATFQADETSAPLSVSGLTFVADADPNADPFATFVQ